MSSGVTRRGMVAGALAAVPALSQTPAPSSSPELDRARANMAANIDAIRAVPLALSIQPAFVFKP